MPHDLYSHPDSGIILIRFQIEGQWYEIPYATFRKLELTVAEQRKYNGDRYDSVIKFLGPDSNQYRRLEKPRSIIPKSEFRIYIQEV